MAATHLVLVGFPATAAAGAVIGPFTVEARDAGNALDDRFIGQVMVTVQTGAGTLGGAQVYGLDSGVATIDDLTYDAAGVGVELLFADLDEVLTSAVGTLTVTGASDARVGQRMGMMGVG